VRLSLYVYQFQNNILKIKNNVLRVDFYSPEQYSSKCDRPYRKSDACALKPTI
jgi:hypothetical protein